MQSPTEYYSDENNTSDVQITKVIFPCKSYGLHPSGIVLCGVRHSMCPRRKQILTWARPGSLSGWWVFPHENKKESLLITGPLIQ